ncbi:hypothetical protein [Flavihumibacter solisilvae]|uniref:Uncharacterized protein n=1 Tax=Flavihumibacter solisilvae TaxID=1349421 RepID=A0A0C1KS53_9BACT|nr:hypothetical protein [Flavihumibacter solisilvae]KIC90276.1 hypothetical protein OI18_23300 [Flavihumibacter solisilvae]
MYLFKVEDTFMITDRGLTLTPGFGDQKVKVGDKIKIVRPDNTIVETIIRGISFGDHSILVGKELLKEDVPIDSEVWLIRD